MNAPTILIVEDDFEMNMLMALALRMEKYEVLQAYAGEEALTLAAEHQPDLILLDVMLPRMTGYEIAKTLHEQETTAHIPIIFVTARQDLDDLVQGLEWAVDYISKPFAVPELMARMRVAIRRALRERQYEKLIIAQNREGPNLVLPNERKNIFLCHASEDKETIRELDRNLTAAGFATWFDEKDILAGQNWDLEIQQALRAAAIALVCVSQTSARKRGYIQKEIRMALQVLDQIPEDEVFVIPVLLEPYDLSALPARISNRQAIKLYEANGFERLVRDIRYHLQQSACS